MSAQPPDPPSSLSQHTDTSEQRNAKPPDSTDLSGGRAVESSKEVPRSTIPIGIGKFFVFLLIGIGALGIIAGQLGLPSQSPEYDQFMVQHFWKVLVGAAIVAGAVDLVPWLLTRRRERIKTRELVLTKRVNALRVMVHEAQEVSRELEHYLEERLAALEVLNKQTQDKEHLAGLNPDEVKALDRELHRQFTNHRRSGLIEQTVFLLLAFTLGFIVNWLSDPLLDELRRWWS